jgi:hypothetical protein
MATAWGGADPIQVADGSDYELGVEYLANEDLTITHVRVWAGAGELGFSGRRGRIWSTAGGLLGIATVPDTLPTGWSTHALDEPVVRTAGQHWVVSYSTGGNYGALAGALDGPVNSADDAVTAVAGGSGVHGNGSFEGTPTQFPTTPSGSNAFYGIDCQYTLGIGGNTAPRITQLTAQAAGAVVTAVVVAEDDETLVGATYRYAWGDGEPDTVSSAATAQHTYATSGTYAVLVSVTDAGGLADHAAVPVLVVVPASDLGALDSRAIINAVRSHALASGYFEAAPGHEPKSKPGAGLTCAVWLQRGPTPVARQSGLAATSARLALNVRVYTNMVADPQDEIDPRIAAAVDALMAAYNGDFTLGGLVAEVDVFGMHGVLLDAVAGYLNQDGALYRVVTITLPVIINNAWEQSP